MWRIRKNLAGSVSSKAVISKSIILSCHFETESIRSSQIYLRPTLPNVSPTLFQMHALFSKDAVAETSMNLDKYDVIKIPLLQTI